MSETPAKLESPPVKVSSGSIGIWFGLLIVLLFLAGGFMHWHHQGQLARLEGQLQSANANTSRLQDILANLKQSLVQTQSEQRAFATAQRHFEQALSQMTDFTQADWLLAESAYLGNLAVARLETSQDIPVALKQLSWAQTRLNKVSDPSLLPLKERLAKDISKLEALKALDWEQIWVSLGTLSDTLETLPFQVSLEAEPSHELPKAQKKNWETRLAASWDQIKSLIRVRRQSDAATLPLVTASEKQHYLFSMQFLIEEARWAVIHRNTAVYSGALQLLNHRLETQFDMSAASVKTFSSEVKRLSDIDLTLTIPDLSELVRLFDQTQSRRTGGV